MQYLLLIYHSQAEFLKTSESDMATIYQQYGQLREELSGKSQFLGGNQLGLSLIHI